MALVRRKRDTAAQPAKHMGIDRYGSKVVSEVPVQNQASGFLRHLIARVVRENMSPADVVMALRLEPAELQALFSLETIAQWSSLERFWHWPMAAAARSSEQAVKNFGRGYAIWNTDENAWHAMVRRACKARGEDVPAPPAGGLEELLAQVGAR